jgi:methylmalonyl-CoA mutase N-terminal domain/subunit
VEWAIERGLPVDSFAPRLSFFFNAHSDFFEEIAKFRAARAIWAEVMRDRFQAHDERSLRLRTHAQTAGCSLTWQQPYNNIVRTALQGLAAVLGGTQSLHTNSLDEAYALPSQEAATIALRTQQIIAHESGVPAVADPLGGSYFVENLTQEIKDRANQYIRRIDELGGMIPAIERGYPQTEIANASYEYQRAIETGEQKIVGVNAFYTGQKEPIQLLQIDDAPAKTQRERLAKVRSERDGAQVTNALEALKRCAESGKNTMPFILDAVREYATVGEICDAFREVFGSYTETSIS